ncbi:MAG: single-stranded-DNA-specific exonuclease RecJ [Chloroflexi bacterium]|nr:single-stranded-DNA-specific exonuclease RecJ [Chloroflexota bacterium]
MFHSDYTTTLPALLIRVYTILVTKTKRWSIPSVLSDQAKADLEAFPPILRQLLFNRGYSDKKSANIFLRADAGIDTSPFGMTGMRATVDRILYALDHQEQVAIYGDYDVDGVTATALLVQTLKALGVQARGYIPNRFDEGYGLNNEALTALKEEGVELVITVDCGIRSPAEAAHARSIGLDLIISDHHQPSDTLPAAFAVINPKQPDDLYQDKDLAGVGIAYKIAQALVESYLATGQVTDFRPEILLDLVALGTVADLAPLTGENRMLVRKGLECIRSTSRQGLFALANVAEMTIAKTTATNIGFVLGPRLNAAGRLDSALAAFDLLSTQDLMLAGQLAQQLEAQNRSRQEITRKIQAEAEAMALTGDPEAFILFAVSPEFNSGVVGLAASRLVETYYRPAIVGQQSEETTRCSCRSIPEFHITQALDECADLLVRHGGHAAAAGFTVKNENLEELQRRLKLLAKEKLGDRDLRPVLSADMVVPLGDMNADVIKNMEYLQPTGYGNPEPVFVSRNLQVKASRTVGMDAKHLKLTLSDGRVSFDAIGFRLGHLKASMPPRVDVMYTFETNEFNGRTTLQLNLKDVKAAGEPDEA